MKTIIDKVKQFKQMAEDMHKLKLEILELAELADCAWDEDSRGEFMRIMYDDFRYTGKECHLLTSELYDIMN